MSPGFLIFIAVVAFIISGMIAHFVAESRGRPGWEPWLITVVAAGLAAGCIAIMPRLLFILALAPLPPVAMLLFRRMRSAEEPLTCPCPHCRSKFVVDARYSGQPVSCPSCQKLFLGPQVTEA